jgi:SAM-dependent methyltransferase
LQISSSPHTLLDKPSAWVARFAPLIPAGEVLDLACGSGRHARLLACLGHPVLAVDRDPIALQNTVGASITTLLADLEEDAAWPFAAGRFAGIVVANYLHRPLFPQIFRGLAQGGVLIYETFAQGNEHFGKPSNPLFLLRHGELLDIAKESGLTLQVLAFEDGYVDTPRPAMVQRICIIRADALLVPECLRLI